MVQSKPLQYALRLGLAISPMMLLAGIAQAENDHDRARELSESGEIMPLEQILQHIKQYRPGRVLEVELDDEHGRYVYEVELVDESGIVRELSVDAQSGELVSDKQDRE